MHASTTYSLSRLVLGIFPGFCAMSKLVGTVIEIYSLFCPYGFCPCGLQRPWPMMRWHRKLTGETDAEVTRRTPQVGDIETLVRFSLAVSYHSALSALF